MTNSEIQRGPEWAFEGPLVSVGQKLFWLLPARRIRKGAVVIPVKVTEINNVHTVNDKTAWHTIDDSGRDDVHQANDDKLDAGGWPTWEDIGRPDLGKLCNQFIWIDEPVGHAIQLGRDDGLFLSLEEALHYAPVTKPKYLQRRLRRYRNDSRKFIASTAWITGFKPLPDKRVYVRRS